MDHTSDLLTLLMVLAEPKVHLDSIPNPSVALIQCRKPKANKGWGLVRTSPFPGGQ